MSMPSFATEDITTLEKQERKKMVENLREGDRVRIKRKEEIGEEVINRRSIASHFLYTYSGKSGKIRKIDYNRMSIETDGGILRIGRFDVIIEKESLIPEELFKID